MNVSIPEIGNMSKFRCTMDYQNGFLVCRFYYENGQFIGKMINSDNEFHFTSERQMNNFLEDMNKFLFSQASKKWYNDFKQSLSG